MAELGGGFFPDDDDVEAGRPMHVAPATQSVRGRVAPAPRVSHYAGEDLEGEEALAALEADDAPPPARTASAGASAVPARTGSCIECHAADGQPKFRDAFGLEVCFDCQRAHRGAGGKYRVISKSTAKTEYMLSDRALDGAKGGLGSFAVPNPHDARYGEMRLYLQSQAAAADTRASIGITIRAGGAARRRRRAHRAGDLLLSLAACTSAGRGGGDRTVGDRRGDARGEGAPFRRAQ